MFGIKMRVGVNRKVTVKEYIRNGGTYSCTVDVEDFSEDEA